MPHEFESAPAGGLNTMMLPRFGSVNRKLTRSTSTRWPISSVGTIDSLGIRNGLTRNAWIPSASPRATATIETSSRREPPALFCLIPATAMGRSGLTGGLAAVFLVAVR